MERQDVHRWVDSYAQAWRTSGIEALAELFTAAAAYRPSPWKSPIEGLDAIGQFWEDGRDGPDEAFELGYEVVAVDGSTAVVRVDVEYAFGGAWRDLWVLRFAADGRCSSFEEWPFAPRQRDGH